MHADLESATDVAQHALYDPSTPSKVDDEKSIDAAVRSGSLLAMYTATDGALGYRVFVDEELPEALRARISATTTDILLRVPSGKLVASGMETANDPGQAASTMELPKGNYLVDVHELDYDWDRDIAPVLREELGGAYRREVVTGPIVGALTLGGIGCAVGGAFAWNWTLALGGGIALAAGVALAKLLPGKAYEAKKDAIAKRFPGLVLVLRRLDDGADLSAHAGKHVSFTD